MCQRNDPGRLKSFRLAVPYRESFAWVKGVVLLLEEGEREGSNEGLSPDRSPSPKPEGGPPPDTRHRHLQAMVSLLRPEDTVKLVGGIFPRTSIDTLVVFQLWRLVCDVSQGAFKGALCCRLQTRRATTGTIDHKKMLDNAEPFCSERRRRMFSFQLVRSIRNHFNP